MSTQEDKISSTSSSYQRQTILSLYSSGIERDVISRQLDLSIDEVDRVIEEEEQRNKEQQPEDLKNTSEIYSRNVNSNSVIWWLCPEVYRRCDSSILYN